MENFVRSEMLIGEEAIRKLSVARVLVFGVGGVGGFVVEALARSGVGNLTLVDHDDVAASNINRQIIATTSNLGEKKIDCMEKRIRDINPSCNVVKKDMFYLNYEEAGIDFKEYDYIIDAIDTISAKLDIIVTAKEKEINIISCMGTGNKIEPTMIEVSDISKTSMCPLAKVMRRELKQRGIYKLKVVYSKEAPRSERVIRNGGKTTPASMIFVPAVAGITIANEVVKDIIL